MNKLYLRKRRLTKKNKKSEKDQDTKMPGENVNINEDNNASNQDSNEERLDNDQEKKTDYEELESEYNKLVTQSKEYFEGWQRERADFLNYKKRIEREQASLKNFVTGEIINKYLAVLDDMGLAF